MSGVSSGGARERLRMWIGGEILVVAEDSNNPWVFLFGIFKVIFEIFWQTS